MPYNSGNAPAGVPPYRVWWHAQDGWDRPETPYGTLEEALDVARRGPPSDTAHVIDARGLTVRTLRGEFL